MTLRTSLLLAALLAAARGAEVSSADIAAALQQGDECTEQDEESGQCALAAIQLRGERSKAAGHTSPAPVSLVTACRSSAIGQMIEREAPQCAERCPGLCKGAMALIAAKGQTQSAKEIQQVVCTSDETSDADLSCALTPANAEACQPLLIAAAARLPSVPASQEAFEAMCKGGSANSLLQAEAEAKEEVVVATLLARAAAGDSASAKDMMDRALAGKKENPICMNAPEGQTCVPNEKGHSDSYIYCSAHKELSPQSTYCPSKMGPMSWCVGGGLGLTHDYCDDPFCRNGGAQHGDGKYCHLGKIVACSGENAPSVVDSCPDSYWTSDDCTTTQVYACAGDWPNPYCAFQYETTSCSPA